MQTKTQSITKFISKHLAIVYTGGFIILISLLISLLCFEKITGITLKKTELHEKRTFAKFPQIFKLPVAVLPEKLEDYFNDNLPLRSQIIYKYRKLWKNCLTRSMPIKGKDNHYFFSDTLDDYRGLQQISMPMLYNISTYLTGMHLFWKMSGANFYIFLTPDKPAMHPEYLPYWVSSNKSAGKKISAFFAKRNTLGIDFTALAPALNQRKKNLLYFDKLYDTVHWNGNAIAEFNRILCERLQSNPFFTTIDPEKSFSIVNISKQIDIAGFDQKEVVPWININDQNLSVLENNYPYFNPKKANWMDTDIIINNKVSKGTMLVICDSFLKLTHQNTVSNSFGKILPIANNVHKFICTHTARSSFDFIWNLYNDHHPDITIYEFSEKMSKEMLPIRQDNREFFIAGELNLNDARLFITPQNIMNIQGNNSLILNSNNNAIDITFSKSSQSLNLPSIIPNQDGRIVVMAKVHSPVAAEAILHYKQSENKYHKFNTIKQALKEGDNYIYIQLFGETAKAFQLQLSFNKPDQTYTIYPKPTVTEIFKEKK